MLKRLLIVLLVVFLIVFVPFFIGKIVFKNRELLLGNDRDGFTLSCNGLELILAFLLVVAILKAIGDGFIWIITGKD